MTASEDIREQLRKDHESVLAELAALASETDDRAAASRLAVLRRSWVIHALCVETVVFPAVAQGELEGRFSAEELVEIGKRFELARDKLTLLEEAKAA